MPAHAVDWDRDPSEYEKNRRRKRKRRCGTAQRAFIEGKPLSAREKEVLFYVAKGLTGPDIAGVLEVSKSTAVTHIEHIFAKFNVSSKVEAVVTGLKQGVLFLDDL
jgi:DNA-binding CsgD family transcriptional regulator